MHTYIYTGIIYSSAKGSFERQGPTPHEICCLSQKHGFCIIAASRSARPALSLAITQRSTICCSALHQAALCIHRCIEQCPASVVASSSARPTFRGLALTLSTAPCIELQVPAVHRALALKLSSALHLVVPALQ